MRRWMFVLPLLVIGVGLGCGERETTEPDPTEQEPPPAAPRILSVSPPPGTAVSDTVTISVTAEAADSVRFSLGEDVLGVDSLPPYEFVWNTHGTPDGSCSLVIGARNEAGDADTTVTYEVSNPGAERTVTISPRAATVAFEDTLRFSAVVVGFEDTRVTWNLRAAFPGDSGADLGTIDATGLYRAPSVIPPSGQVQVDATTVAAPRLTDTALLTLTPGEVDPPVVTVSPKSVRLAGGASAQFSATVENSEDQSVIWSVDGGATHGSITSGGLYTAPWALPEPALAIVRARSAVDETASDSALVELVPPPPPDEGDLLAATFWDGYYRAAFVSDRAAGVVFRSLYIAKDANGGEVTTHGTLEQRPDRSPTNPDGWTWDPEPADRLILDPTDGPTWSIEVLSFDINSLTFPVDYEPGSGYEYRDTLDCRILVDGNELHLTSVPLTDDQWWRKPACVQSYSDFRRTLVGEIGTKGGGVWTVDLQHEGRVDYGSCAWAMEGAVEGQMTTQDGIAMTLHTGFTVMHSWGDGSSSGGFDWTFTGDLTAQSASATHVWTDLALEGHVWIWGAGNWDVVRSGEWAAEGTVTRNGSAYGGFRFDAPVVQGADPVANTLLDYGPGYSLILLRPEPVEWHDVETVVPSPFFAAWSKPR